LDETDRLDVDSGLLQRRPIREGARAYIGREANRIEEVRMGLWHELDDVLANYGRARIRGRATCSRYFERWPSAIW
jgi:hypothetical protein